MTWRGLWLVICCVGFAWAADPQESTLSYLKGHPEDWPKQVLLKQATPFKIILNGKEAGSMSVPDLTVVTLVAVLDDKLEISNGVSTTTIVAENTDLWERVTAIRAERAKRPDPARDDPAYRLPLPVNSEPVAWYKQKIDGELKPWLEKYATHKLAPEMKERVAAFEAEAARVTAGEVRRGERWYNATEAAAHRVQFTVEDMQTRLEQALKAKDLNQLQSCLAEVEKYAKTAAHPKLHRAAHNAIQAIQTSITDEPAKKALAEWSKKWPFEKVLLEEKALEQLQHIAELKPAAALPVLIEVDKVWPGNELTTPIFLDLETKQLAQIDAELLAGRIREASQALTLLEKMIAATPTRPPRFEEIRKKTEALKPGLNLAKDAMTAYDENDFERASSITFNNAPVSLQKWHAALKEKIVNRREDSSRSVSQAEHDLIHLRFSAAQAAFAKAKELWPENPEIASRERILSGAKWIGGLFGVLVILSLLSYAYSKWDHYRFKRALKRKAEESRTLPREF
ncbi:MAG: hypothetical protein B9S32_17700 [Verrucomicrobia bacterium Tous-C9LFEB]|nr:MAG: hypothetical protein B9S32_17700 [Verrucomicrobia bacterium Tous-C9LFEB]